jgi:hypothetical protein
MKREHLILAVIILILLTPPAAVVAQTLTHSASPGVPYVTNSGVEVTLGDDRDIAAQPFVDNETWSSGNVTITGSDADVRVADATFDSDEIDVRAVDVQGELTVARSDLDRSVTIEDGDANLLQVRNYSVDNGNEDLAYASDNGLTVTLDGFDSIGVAAVDADTGEPLDSENVGGDGEATFELPDGQRAIRFEAVPSELQVRNELKPAQLITENATLTARLFADGDVIAERDVTNGTVSLAGVPLDEEIIITVREENADYVYRRILIESAIQTSEIYLLPTDEPSAQVRFQLRDDTGRFGDSGNTRFFVEKPVTRDYDGDGTNETRYQVISGDRIGADGEFPTILVDSQRYRLRVENDEGEQRVLGSYVVQGATTSTIPIGSVEFTGDVDEGAALQTKLREAPDSASHEYEVRLVYIDPEGETSEIDISITNSTGGTIRPTTTEQINGTAAYVETYPITDTSFNPEEDTATVEVVATRGFEQQTFTQRLGDVPPVDIGPLPEDLVELAALGSVLAVLGLLAIINPAMAALVTPGYAGLLVLIGLAPIPMPAVVLAGLVGVLAAVGTRGG